jgi:hypothetical protein
MFLNYIKNYFLLKILKNNFRNVNSASSSDVIQTVGLLIDESYFFEKEALLQEVIANGIVEHNIKIVVYRDKIKKTEVYSHSTFGSKDMNWNLKIQNAEVNDFINQKFNLLISYYDLEKAMLLKVTHDSKAEFKVGFSAIDKKLNHLMINTNAENHTVFVHELFRYLKILNKI